jgi:aminomethyltransferase
MNLKTSLFDCHVVSNGTMVSFAGYMLPIHYPTGIIAEHLAVRTAAGLFDVSHMGEIAVSGKDALQYLNYLLTNDFTSMTDGQVRYSVMCNEQGGCVDDLIVYRLNCETYWLVVNASNRAKDYRWMCSRAFGDVTIEDISDRIAQLALQGPHAKDILLQLVSESALPAKYYTFQNDVMIGGIKCLISQTGYTGEAGYELYLSNGDAPAMWNLLLEKGRDNGLIPCGLGARDTLRLEAAMPLYGHEMGEGISPLEVGLNFAVKMKKENFIGKEMLVEKGEPKIKRFGLRITGRGIARENQDVLNGSMIIGHTTSGAPAPYLKYPVAMALLCAEGIEIGTQLEVDVRGRRVAAEVVPMPFYKREK